MNRKALCLALIIVLIFCCGIAFASENNTTALEIGSDEILEIHNETVLQDGEQVNATSAGI